MKTISIAKNRAELAEVRRAIKTELDFLRTLNAETEIMNRANAERAEQHQQDAQLYRNVSMAVRVWVTRTWQRFFPPEEEDF